LPAEDQRTGLIILGGFLGAGKSTWLRHQLRAGMLRGAEVFVNEAAGTPVDDLLLADAARVTVLAGGCACCDGRPALVAALREWCDRRNGATRVILETSGLADPARIAEAVRADPVLTHHLRVSEVIVLADALNVLVQLAAEPLGWQQIEAADRIVLTKGEALPDARLAALAGALARINPDALIEAAEQGVARALPLLAGFEPAQLPPHPGNAEPITPTELVMMPGTDPSAVLVWLSALLHARGGDLVRVKGVVRTAACRLLIQAVRGVVQQPQILPDADRPDTDDRLIVLGRGASPERLRESFTYFTAS